MSDEQSKLDAFKEKYAVKEFKRAEPTTPQNFDGGPSDYSYITKLIQKPIKDGRHRVLWYILTPWAINILKLEKADAYELVQTYLNECNDAEATDAIEKVEYYIDYAITTGLYPPRLETLKEHDIELYDIVMKAISE
jgi:non-catalytic primase subunit PriX-like protein